VHLRIIPKGLFLSHIRIPQYKISSGDFFLIFGPDVKAPRRARPVRHTAGDGVSEIPMFQTVEAKVFKVR